MCTLCSWYDLCFQFHYLYSIAHVCTLFVDGNDLSQ